KWRNWLSLSGRAAGKTRQGAEWTRHLAETPGQLIALVGATYRDVRETMVEGISGILSVCPPWFTPEWNPSRLLLRWPNNSIARGFTADEPRRLRGPAFTAVWADELAAWHDPEECWRQISFTNRIRSTTGTRVLVTTTPKAIPILRKLIADP